MLRRFEVTHKRFDLVRELGRRWAAELRPETGDLRSRVTAASALLNELGGVTEVKDSDGHLRIQGFSCPLDLVVRENPRVCLAIEAFLSELVDTPVKEQCDRSGGRARCCFEVSG